MSATNEEQEEEEESGREPNVFREDKKRHKEELNFDQVWQFKFYFFQNKLWRFKNIKNESQNFGLTHQKFRCVI